MRRVIATCATVLLWLHAGGCNRGPAPGPVISVGGPTGSATWHHGPDGGPPIPGIDEGSAYFAGRLFLIWADAGGVSAGSSGGPEGFTADGVLTTQDGRRVPFGCTSPDGKGGQAVIDGTPHDLAAGRLFLVATGGGKVRVKQFSTDLSGLRLEAPDFRAFGRGQPEIMAFFQTAKK